MPRTARLDSPGTLHHVIIRGIERRSIVNDNRDREDFVSRLGRLAMETGTRVYAWSIMSNHAHILLRSSPEGLPAFMRRLLTGYAVRFNLRHDRHGHLFQNRYHSIVCQEDGYLQELVRYIHLNQIRAGQIRDLEELDRYLWCGHAVMMGKIKHPWQDRDYVLSWFGKKEGEARRAYRRYMEEGMKQGRRPELSVRVRSCGEFSMGVSMRRDGETSGSDQRILGTKDFVKEILMEAESRRKQSLSPVERRLKMNQVIKERCVSDRVSEEELLGGSRRKQISKVRMEIAEQVVEGIGVPLAETARALGVSTSAISKMFRRRADKSI
jgi:putative transposase